MNDERSKWILGSLLFAEMVFLGSTFREWGPLVAGLLAACAVVVMREARTNRRTIEESVESEVRTGSLARSFRWIGLLVCLVSIVLATLAWRLGGNLGESVNVVYLGADVLAHAAFFLSLAVWSMRPRRGHVALLPMGLVVVLLCVAAGGVSTSLASQTAVGMATCLGFTAASQIIGSSRQNRRRSRGRSIHPTPSDETSWFSSPWLGPLFSTLTVSGLLMATSAIAGVTERVLPDVQTRLRETLKVSLDAVSEDRLVSGMRYVSGSRLGSIRRHLTADPAGVALLVHADATPGYLRGTAFDLYRNRQWYMASEVINDELDSKPSIRDRAVPPTGFGATPLNSRSERPLSKFNLAAPTSGAKITVEIENDPMKGSTVFLPLATEFLEARGGELIISHHGIVRTGVNIKQPYVAGVVARPARDQLSDQERRILLDIPSSVEPMVRNLVDEICKPESTPEVKAAAISRFFQGEFDYGLNETRSPNDVDPLTHFLRTRHKAHCEYFASATVLMMRAAGVPARYVTGYVADEVSDDDTRRWLARNRDAHAWVEAFDESTGLWFAVESTPGRQYQTILPMGDGANTLDGDSSLVGDQMLDETGFWAVIGQMVGWIWSVRTTDTLLVIFRVAQLPIVIALVFWLWNRYWGNQRRGDDSIDQRSRKMLSRADRQTRRLALVRSPHETLYQFADRIEATTSEKYNVASIARWYRQYADARYQGRLPHDGQSPNRASFG